MEAEFAGLFLPFGVMDQQMLAVDGVGDLGGVGFIAGLIDVLLEAFFFH